MLRIIILGDRQSRMQLWELLSMQGVVEEFAFVDTDAGGLSMNPLGIVNRTVDWLFDAMGKWDRVLIANEDVVSVAQLVQSGWAAESVLSLPASPRDTTGTAIWVREHFPDPLRQILECESFSGQTVTVGIFGTGSGGVRVWEALSMIDTCEVAWFADNDKRKQGGTFFGLDVIAPSSIPRMNFSVIVIASMHRAAISDQLLSLGVRRDKMLTPSVTGSMEQIRTYLASMIGGQFAGDL